MPPTLRSAQSSPSGKAADASPDIAPGRKEPKCTKCAQSRRGHPRSGCPNTTKSKDMSEEELEEHLSKALESIGLYSKPKESHGRYRALRSSDTLVSISPSAKDILHHLTKPSFFSQKTKSKDNESKRSKGQNTIDPIKLKMNSGPQVLMPGTLKAPSWESSIDGLPDVKIEELSPTKISLGTQTSFRGSDCDIVPTPLPHLQSNPSSGPALFVQRSQTQEQRQLFLASLSQASPASVYIHSRQDVDEVKVSAEAAKLHVRPIYSEDKEEKDVLLVIGSDLNAVEKLAEELTKSIQDSNSNIASKISTTAGRTSSASSTFKAIASGAIMGALGTWAGLAFS